MEGDTLLDSDSGSFDSLTFLPAGSNLEERPSKKRSFDNLSNTSTTLPSTSSLQRASAQKDKKKRKVSFMISDDDEGKKEVAGKPNHDEGDIKLSKEEIEEMKRKTEHWWSLPDGTTQEEFDHAFDHFKDGRYFQTHMEIEWMDVQIQRACGRLLSQDQFRCASLPFHLRVPSPVAFRAQLASLARLPSLLIFPSLVQRPRTTAVRSDPCSDDAQRCRTCGEACPRGP